MAFFVAPTSKLERAVRSLIANQTVGGQNIGTWENTFLGDDSNLAVLPHRRVVGVSFSPKVGWRPEGIVQLNIEHKFAAKDQPTAIKNTQRTNFNTFLGQTIDLLNCGGTNDQDNTALAQAITYAGRWLAITDGSPAGNLIAQQNLDMQYFRCDWVKANSPLISRGHPDGQGDFWVEIVHLSAFVSHATN